MIEPVGKSDDGECLLRLHGPGGNLGYQRHIFTRRQARDQIIELEDKTDMIAPKECQLALAHIREIVIAKTNFA